MKKYIIIKDGRAIQANEWSDLIKAQFYLGASVYMIDGNQVYKLESKGVWSLLDTFHV